MSTVRMDAGVEVSRTTQSDSELARPHPQDIAQKGLLWFPRSRAERVKSAGKAQEGALAPPSHGLLHHLPLQGSCLANCPSSPGQSFSSAAQESITSIQPHWDPSISRSSPPPSLTLAHKQHMYLACLHREGGTPRYLQQRCQVRAGESTTEIHNGKGSELVDGAGIRS